MTSRRFRRAICVLPLALAVLLPVAAPASAGVTACAAADSSPENARAAQLEHTILCLVNRERMIRGLPKLRSDNDLADAAKRHSRDMKHRRFFSHDSPGGSDLMDRVRKAGYKGWFVGENIAWGSGSLGTPAEIVESWMRSPGHRANILRRKFREIGVGVALGSPRMGISLPAAIYTTDFGSPR